MYRAGRVKVFVATTLRNIKSKHVRSNTVLCCSTTKNWHILISKQRPFVTMANARKRALKVLAK